MLLVGAGLLAYSAWLLEFLLPTGVSPLRDPVQRLLLDPGHPVFRDALVVAGLAFLLAGPPLVRLSPVQWTGRLSAGLVSVFGIAVLVEAAFPGAGVPIFVTNVIFVVGTLSLVLWWPPAWRRLAATGLVLVVLSWLAVIVANGLGDYAGLATRVQLVVRVALLAVGLTYVLTPVPRYASRGG